MIADRVRPFALPPHGLERKIRVRRRTRGGKSNFQISGVKGFFQIATTVGAGKIFSNRLKSIGGNNYKVNTGNNSSQSLQQSDSIRIGKMIINDRGIMMKSFCKSQSFAGGGAAVERISGPSQKVFQRTSERSFSFNYEHPTRLHIHSYTLVQLRLIVCKQRAKRWGASEPHSAWVSEPEGEGVEKGEWIILSNPSSASPLPRGGGVLPA